MSYMYVKSYKGTPYKDKLIGKVFKVPVGDCKCTMNGLDKCGVHNGIKKA